MAPSTRLPRAAAAVAAVALAAATLSRATDTPAADDICRAITHFNVIALEDFHLTSSEVLGPLAVGGDARLEAFAVNPKGACDRDGRTPSAIALAVGGRLRADNGQINAGKVLVGRGKYAGTSVGLRCAKVVHQEVDLADLEEYVTDTHTQLCERRPPAGCRTAVDEAGGIKFTIRGGDREPVCEVHAADLGRASGVAIVGRRDHQTVFIKVLGGRGGDDDRKALTLTNFGFFGFVPERTALALCNVPRLVVDNVGIPAAVFGPRTHLSGPAGHILGTTIVRSFRGGVEFQHAPFSCDKVEEVPSPSPDV